MEFDLYHDKDLKNLKNLDRMLTQMKERKVSPFGAKRSILVECLAPEMRDIIFEVPKSATNELNSWLVLNQPRYRMSKSKVGKRWIKVQPSL